MAMRLAPVLGNRLREIREHATKALVAKTRSPDYDRPEIRSGLVDLDSIEVSRC